MASFILHPQEFFYQGSLYRHPQEKQSNQSDHHANQDKSVNRSPGLISTLQPASFSMLLMKARDTLEIH